MANFVVDKRMQALDTDIFRWCNGKIVDDTNYEVSFDGWRKSYNRIMDKDMIREPIDGYDILRRRFVRNDDNSLAREEAQRLIRGDIVYFHRDEKDQEDKVWINDPFLDVITLESKQEVPYSELKNGREVTTKSKKKTPKLDDRLDISSSKKSKRPNDENIPPSKKQKRKKTSGLTFLDNNDTSLQEYTPSSDEESATTKTANSSTPVTKLTNEQKRACEKFSLTQDLNDVIQELGLEIFPQTPEKTSLDVPKQRQKKRETTETTTTTCHEKNSVPSPSDQAQETSHSVETIECAPKISLPSPSDQAPDISSSMKTIERAPETSQADLQLSSIFNCVPETEMESMRTEIVSLKEEVVDLKQQVSTLQGTVLEIKDLLVTWAQNSKSPTIEHQSSAVICVKPPTHKVKVTCQNFWRISVGDFPSQLSDASVSCSTNEVEKKEPTSRKTPDGSFHILKNVVREAELEAQSEETKFARSLYKNFFTIGEIYDRNVKGRAKVRGGCAKKPLNAEKVLSLKEEVFRYFPENIPTDKIKTWQKCVNEINRHILYRNNKIDEYIDFSAIGIPE